MLVNDICVGLSMSNTVLFYLIHGGIVVSTDTEIALSCVIAAAAASGSDCLIYFKTISFSSWR